MHIQPTCITYISVLGVLAIDIENVYTAYPKSNDAALKGITLKVRHGEFMLITGPNGAGKTTLLELILGFLRPIHGRVRVLGLEMPRHAKRVRKYCSYVMQDFMKPYTTPYTCKEVIFMGLAPFKAPFEGIRPREMRLFEEITTILGIGDLMDRPFGTLSGGQQQRVMLARALLRRPKILLLDEPFSSIDRESREDFADLLLDIRNMWGMTILAVTHTTEFLARHSDRIVELRDGRMVKNE